MMIRHFNIHFSILRFSLVLAAITLVLSIPVEAQSPSALQKNNGRLDYYIDTEENRIPDFSHAGYRGGGISIPTVPVRIQLSPSGSDDTERIRRALKTVAKRNPDRNGHRGAVLLKPGTYQISEPIRIPWSGVVLRGSGDDSDPRRNTILKIKSSVNETVIVAGNPEANWFRNENGITYISSSFVPVGARNFKVEDASLFGTGDNIIIRHRSSQEWIDSVNGGDTANGPPWEPGYMEIYYNRYITGISGNTISIDAPIYQHFDTELTRIQVYKLDKKKIVSEIGIESLRIDIESNNPSDEDHAKNGIILTGLENAWVKNVTILHFSHTGIGTRTASNITIEDTQAIYPHSRLTGERRYNFNALHFSNNILFKGVRSVNGRRSFVSNGTSVASGIVFLRSRSEGALRSSEGHQRWSQALLYDNVTFKNPETPIVLGLYNRGDLGSSHGWASVHSVAWNVEASGRQIIIQKPPGAQNYSIGSNGEITANWLFNHPPGHIENSGSKPLPESLYEAQLAERLQYGIRPDTPARLRVSNSTKNMLKLSWEHASVHPTDYLIERSDDGGLTFRQVAVQTQSDSTYIDLEIAEKTYQYRIRARNKNGISNYSAPYSSTPQFNSDALPDFQLREPIDQFEKNVLDPDAPLTFRWDPIETTLEISERWILYGGSEPVGRPAAVLDVTGKESLELTNRELIELLGHDKYSIGPVHEATWTVRRESKTLEREAGTRHHIRLITDFIEPFDLKTPANEFQAGLESSLSDTLYFEWEPTASPRNVEYTWLLDIAGNNFSQPIATVNIGSEPNFKLTLNRIVHFLETSGTVFDRRLDLEWTVFAGTSTMEKSAANPFQLRLTKVEGSPLLSEQKTSSELIQNYPNPFNPVTTIRYYLSEASKISLDVYDLAGVHVATLERGEKERGYYQVLFNGSKLSSGVYFYRLKTNSDVFTQKMILVK